MLGRRTRIFRQSQGLVRFVSHLGQHILYSQGVGLVLLRSVNLSMLSPNILY